MQIPRIDPKNAAGLFDKVLGLGQELVGTVTSNQRLTKIGQLRQDIGTEKLKAIAAQAEAETHRAKAKAAESQQASAQKVKEAAN